MLKKISPVISPELMKALMEMGHGDELCIADGNFPAHRYGKRVIRMDGHGIPDILKAVLEFFPLDTDMDKPVILMDCNSKDLPGIWETFRSVILASDESSTFSNFELIERFEFYERAGSCFAVIATGEQELYANIILRKGVVK